MIMCLRCNNETRTTTLVTAMGQELLIAGTIGSDPQPIAAQVCTACGFIQLFGPQPFHDSLGSAQAEQPLTVGELLGEQQPLPPAA